MFYLLFFRTISVIIMVGFLFTICIVLLNILIAQVSDTYQNVQQDAQREFEVNRASIVTRVEINSPCFCKVIIICKIKKRLFSIRSNSCIPPKVLQIIRKYCIKYTCQKMSTTIILILVIIVQ